MIFKSKWLSAINAPPKNLELGLLGQKSRVGAGSIPEELGSLVIPESEDVLKNKTRNHNGEEHVKRTEVPTE